MDSSIETISPLRGAGTSAPFLIEHLKKNLEPNGNFLPAAQVIVTPVLRTSGLLQALSPEDLKVLLLVLTFVTPNGFVHPSIQELAHAMGVSEAKADSRMSRLNGFIWREKP